ncbi:MAG: hypothetical protein ACYC35_13695 [Pirellulales bacterium]
MSLSTDRWRPLQGVLCGLGLLAALCATGCQVDVGGQTLPSPYYLTDDIQYFPPGAEFKLAKEAAAMKASAQGMPMPPPAGAVPGMAVPPPAPAGPGAAVPPAAAPAPNVPARPAPPAPAPLPPAAPAPAAP